MITVTRLDRYYKAISKKRNRAYYYLRTIRNAYPRKSTRPRTYWTYIKLLKDVNRVLKMLRSFNQHFYISVDVNNNYTISDNYLKNGNGEYEARGKFDSVLGGMQVY